MKNTNQPLPTLILASGSRYRRQLLEKLGLEPLQISPDIDERALKNEQPRETAQRLSLAKAQAVAQTQPNALIIASDQVAELEGKAIGKPGTQENAKAQLLASSGKTVVFHTGICLLNSSANRVQLSVETFSVRFRTLNPDQIDQYLQKEQVLDCAGSFKSEGLGIALFQALNGDDPNSLIGLPLIRLIDFLEKENYPIL
ncbi:septum formation inhibitor Maf [Spongiibacter sp. KMU-158]|uniref:7-methyl-GTP pyrophosphatase n=1 Tax=Spongiibacter pelagi TaxID=2760804 RepID=A0A927C4D9_9GAMM|nr:Maf family nucleotide pyrophosphatase [Spongiibacter pelagi]MBD2859662.1 septum formation inhibitor Maf [Spongiibacter pelagi]